MLKANQQYEFARDILYQDFPSHFTWKSKEMIWVPCQRGHAIGRIYNCGTRCRRDISLVSNTPIGTGFGPQNITVITSQESHHWHAFLIRFAETHFPYSLETET